MTLRRHVRAARVRLVAAGVAEAEAALDAELLARYTLGWDRATFVARLSDDAPPAFAAKYDPLIERRTRREPVAHIRGLQEFWGRDFVVSSAVLIPRPETELMIEEALEVIPGAPRCGARPLRALDIGTGSGCLAVTLAIETSCRVIATDCSKAALAVARRNARRLLGPGIDAVEFRLGTYAARAKGPFDVILANPPYVAATYHRHLTPEVRDYEPLMALVGGRDGLRDIRRIVRLSPRLLAPGGTLLLEIGYDQADAVRQIVTDTKGLALLRIRDDLQGIPRVVIIQRT